MPNKAKGGYMKSDSNKGFPKKCTLTGKQIEDIEAVLENDLTGIGIRAVLLADKAGNIIAKHDEELKYDLCALAALGSASCVATDILAKSIGEKGFPVCFFQGKNSSTHFSRINGEFLLIAVSDGKMPTGLLRVKIEEAVGKMRSVLESLKDAFLRLSLPVNFAGETGR